MHYNKYLEKLIRSRGVRDLGWLVSGTGTTQAIGIVSMVFMARTFTPVELGEFFFIQGWTVALSGWSLPGLDASLVSSVALKEGGTYRRAVWLRSAIALGGSACLMGIGSYFGKNQVHLGGWAYAVAAMAFPLSMNTCGWQVLTGQRRYHQISFNQVTNKTLNLFWLLICYLYHLGISAFFVAQLLTTCVINLRLITMNWNKVGAKEIYNPEGIRYGIHLTVSNVLQQPLSQAERLLVGFFYGSTNLAVFGLGEMVYNNMRTIANLSHSFYLPRLVREHNRGVYSYLLKKAAIWTLAFLALSLAFVFLLPLLYPLVLGNQYRESADYAVLYSLAFSLGVPNFFSTIYLRHIRATKATYIYGLLRAPLNLAFIVTSYYLFGIIGLPVGRGLSNIIYCLCAVYIIKNMVEPYIGETGNGTRQLPLV